MLTELDIKNYSIIKNLNIEFMPNMTVVTGETGAGKSIIIDTLELALGARGDVSNIYHGEKRCIITAIFNINNNKAAQNWLRNQDLDNNNECTIKRVLNSDGRSRSTINDINCTQQQIRQFSALLVNIHGQHEQQNLLYADKQRDLLDNFAGLNNLTKEIANLFKSWQETKLQLAALINTTQDYQAKTELLNYQIQELQDLNLQEHELEELHKEHKQLANVEEILIGCQQALNLLAQNNLHTAKNQLTKFCSLDNKINNASNLLANAEIHIEEANYELQRVLDGTELNPKKLQWIETRLSKIHDIARKHRIEPEQLFALQQKLEQKLQTLTDNKNNLQTLEETLAAIKAKYLENAQKLSNQRKQAASKFKAKLIEKMQLLNMPQSNFAINFTAAETSHGIDNLEFLVTTNPGQPLKPLHKIASGGELSRISLAIQTITKQANTPTIIFDEVDVGIGGQTAQVVGQLLQQLAQKAQVICVTHLPQVAIQANHHLCVTKAIVSNNTQINLQHLNSEARINEIARMLAGKITAEALVHAKELLQAINQTNRTCAKI